MDDKEFYLDAIKGIVPEQKEVQLQNVFYSFLEIEHLYDSAINVVKTQLNILNNEFNMRFQRNPIHSIESRIKTPQSIIGKLQRKGFAVSPESAREHLQDIAGVRVICCYIDGGSLASIKFNPYYLEVPVRVGYKYAVNDDFSLFGSVGPYMAVGLFGKAKLKVDGDIADIAELGGNSMSEDIFGDDGLKRFDFGLGLKAGVEFSKKYQVAISYDFGLVEVIKEVGMKNRNLMISLGYMF